MLHTSHVLKPPPMPCSTGLCHCFLTAAGHCQTLPDLNPVYVLNEFSIYIYGVPETVGPHFDIRGREISQAFGWASDSLGVAPPARWAIFL